MQLRSYTLWCFEKSDVNEIEIAFEALRHDKTLLGRIKRTEVPAIKQGLITDIDNVLSETGFEATPSILWSRLRPVPNDPTKFTV